jgi:hypothetical protein
MTFLTQIFDKPELYTLTELHTLKCLEPILLLIGLATHIALTRNAQSTIMHLVAIERILSSFISTEETNTEISKDYKSIWYFSY